jgi:serine phosphatase RsbU (regulator of sigma subunit)
LTAINSIITKNVRMLNEDKYMTITVLAAHQGGKFVFSGLHQDIMIRRAGSGAIDQVETKGFWIGINDNINGLVCDDTFSLGIGDVMLVFTDGITEAWHKNAVQGSRSPERDMFGQEKLVGLLRDHGERSTDEIQNAIIAALSDYQRQDDVTMVMIRRLS